MKFSVILATAFATSLAFACGNNVQDSEVAESAEESLEGAVAQADNAIQDAFGTEPESGANYGTGVAANTAVMSYEQFITKMNGADSLEAAVTGEVVEVCQKKGCWMTLQSPAMADSEVTVRFKDYGFFMPKTLSGSEVVVQGKAKRTMTSVDDLRHYAEDAGKSSAEIAAITEPKEELEFIATGVRVL